MQLQPPTRLLNSLDMMKHIETMLQTAPRTVINGQRVLLIPERSAEAWIAFFGQLVDATEKRQAKEEQNGKRTRSK